VNDKARVNNSPKPSKRSRGFMPFPLLDFYAVA